MPQRLSAAVLAGSLLSVSPVAAQGPGLPAHVQASDPRDAYLAGALDSVLQRELGWAADSYRLEVTEGVATVTVYIDVRERRAAVRRFTGPPGLQALQVAAGRRPEEEISPVRGQFYSFLGIRPETIPFPVGDLFWPLLADPKQPQFFVSYRYYDQRRTQANVAAVGYGETFGLYRRRGRFPGDGLQLSLSGGLFAQFNLDAPSNDLVNADYTIGLPLTYRRGPLSVRLRLYHQSSHLGDEFLLEARPERVNLSYESFEAIAAWRWRGWRIYGGGEYLLYREPGELKREGLHGGLEYRGNNPALWGGSWLGGLDLKSWQENDWQVSASLKAGLEFGAGPPGRRRVRLMLEAYDGFAPHGQFYRDPLRYVGGGVYLGF